MFFSIDVWPVPVCQVLLWTPGYYLVRILSSHWHMTWNSEKNIFGPYSTVVFCKGNCMRWKLKCVIEYAHCLVATLLDVSIGSMPDYPRTVFACTNLFPQVWLLHYRRRSKEHSTDCVAFSLFAGGVFHSSSTGALWIHRCWLLDQPTHVGPRRALYNGLGPWLSNTE